MQFYENMFPEQQNNKINSKNGNLKDIVQQERKKQTCKFSVIRDFKLPEKMFRNHLDCIITEDIKAIGKDFNNQFQFSSLNYYKKIAKILHHQKKHYIQVSLDSLTVKKLPYRVLLQRLSNCGEDLGKKLAVRLDRFDQNFHNMVDYSCKTSSKNKKNSFSTNSDYGQESIGSLETACELMSNLHDQSNVILQQNNNNSVRQSSIDSMKSNMTQQTQISSISNLIYNNINNNNSNNNLEQQQQQKQSQKTTKKRRTKKEIQECKEQQEQQQQKNNNNNTKIKNNLLNEYVGMSSDERDKQQLEGLLAKYAHKGVILFAYRVNKAKYELKLNNIYFNKKMYEILGKTADNFTNHLMRNGFPEIFVQSSNYFQWWMNRMDKIHLKFTFQMMDFQNNPFTCIESRKNVMAENHLFTLQIFEQMVYDNEIQENNTNNNNNLKQIQKNNNNNQQQQKQQDVAIISQQQQNLEIQQQQQQNLNNTRVNKFMQEQYQQQQQIKQKPQNNCTNFNIQLQNSLNCHKENTIIEQIQEEKQIQQDQQQQQIQCGFRQISAEEIKKFVKYN